jgi:hypothetical protein
MPVGPELVRESGHPGIAEFGQKRSFKNAATASRKRPFRALDPNHRHGFDSHHPLHLDSKTWKGLPDPFVIHTGNLRHRELDPGVTHT